MRGGRRAAWGAIRPARLAWGALTPHLTPATQSADYPGLLRVIAWVMNGLGLRVHTATLTCTDDGLAEVCDAPGRACWHPAPCAGVQSQRMAAAPLPTHSAEPARGAVSSCSRVHGRAGTPGRLLQAAAGTLPPPMPARPPIARCCGTQDVFWVTDFKGLKVSEQRWWTDPVPGVLLLGCTAAMRRMVSQLCGAADPPPGRLSPPRPRHAAGAVQPSNRFAEDIEERLSDFLMVCQPDSEGPEPTASCKQAWGGGRWRAGPPLLPANSANPSLPGVAMACGDGTSGLPATGLPPSSLPPSGLPPTPRAPTARARRCDPPCRSMPAATSTSATARTHNSRS